MIIIYNYMREATLHGAQVTVLDTLRRRQAARYSSLQRTTRMDSDVFKFHLRALVRAGCVAKTTSGDYQLTPRGKEFANNIDRNELKTQKQPKLSVMLVVSRDGDNGRLEFLVQQRHRNPYFGYWGFLSGPMRWGEDSVETAKNELRKQTGLRAEFLAKATYRQCDFSAETGILLEDKLFTVMVANISSDDPSNSWTGGHNEWMTLAELTDRKKYFLSSAEIVDMLRDGRAYGSHEFYYRSNEY